MAPSLFHGLVEEKIRKAQEAGAFDNLPGKGKPLDLPDLSWVPDELRMAYHLLKNAHLLPPEAELRRDIQSLWDLLKHTGDEEERRAVFKEIDHKRVRLDLMKRRSFTAGSARPYGKKLVRRLYAVTRRA